MKIEVAWDTAIEVSVTAFATSIAEEAHSSLEVGQVMFMEFMPKSWFGRSTFYIQEEVAFCTVVGEACRLSVTGITVEVSLFWWPRKDS